MTQEIPASSFAIRLNPNRLQKTSSKFFKHWYREWPLFRRKIRKELSVQDCIIITDISGFFEHIDLRLLSEMILEAGVPREVSNLILSQMERWTWRHKFSSNRLRGLLQGNDVSSMYANFYLREVDEWFAGQGLTYHRYMDDMVIHVPDRGMGRRTLAALTQVLRQLGLSLNSSKTRVLCGKSEIEAHFNFGLSDQVEKHYSTILSQGDSPSLKKQRKDLMRQVQKSGDKHIFKRLMTCYTRARDTSFRKASIDLLQNDPDLMENLCRYFRSIVGPQVVDALCNYLQDASLNIHPGQEQELLECLLVLPITSDTMKAKLLAAAWAIVQRHQAHPYSRALAILLGYRLGDSVDVTRLVDFYLQRRENDSVVKMHLALCVSRLVDQGRLTKVIDLLKTEADPQLTEVGVFMENLPSADQATVKRVIGRTGLKTDHYGPKKGGEEVSRLEIRDIILLNLARNSTRTQARYTVKQRVTAWKARVKCVRSKELLDEILARL